MNKDDRVYLRYILDRIRRIEEDIIDGRERFMASHTLQDAVLRNLQVMAESTQRVSETAKATQPTIEWRKIAAFRNILVHDYLGIDLDTVWDITQRSLPELKHENLLSSVTTPDSFIGHSFKVCPRGSCAVREVSL